MPGVYLKQGEAYLQMTETPFDAESVLQALIAQHAQLLSDEEAGQGPLLLVRREAGVGDQEDAGGRWSLDHLYIDREGVPTLVEVKRSSDTRARREVVAQMLDYAANAKTSFSAERMSAWLDDGARERGTTAAQALSDTLGVEEPDAYWETVATNLDAEHFRLIFVSDVIGPELRRIIEFLNGQMARTDVLAIEVKQYVYADHHGEHQTIVPRVIGNTETAKRTKRARSRVKMTDRRSLLAALHEEDSAAADAAAALLDWGESHSRLSVRWTTAGDIGFGPWRGLLRVWSDGTLELKVHTLRWVEPAWDDEQIEQLLQRLEKLDGVTFKGNRRQWPRTPLAPLAEPAIRQPFLSVVDEVVRGVNIEP
ncbi:MAG: hypothetical protein ACR2ML_05965 [Solirubrobacteraceae bacterium]